jgi:branched-chain amino acid aminotransferase
MTPRSCISERTAYFCGQWIAESDVSIAIDDMGFTMGVTVTERLRTFDGKVYRQREHLERMAGSLNHIGLDARQIITELDAAIGDFCARHRDGWRAGDDWAIVLFVTPGRGTGPTVCVHGFPLRFQEWAHHYTEGVSLEVSRHRQVPPSCWPAALKCRSRMHYYLADLEARQSNANSRALLLDQEGFIGEASTANVVAWHPGEGLVTPRSEKVLPGVSMGAVRDLVLFLGIPFAEKDMTVGELLAAEEVWLTSTSVCMLPVTACSGRVVGSGKPGPMYQRVLAAWSEDVGVDIAEQARVWASQGK